MEALIPFQLVFKTEVYIPLLSTRNKVDASLALGLNTKGRVDRCPAGAHRAEPRPQEDRGHNRTQPRAAASRKTQCWKLTKPLLLRQLSQVNLKLLPSQEWEDP
jgi:hypothetical protein